MVGSPSTFMLYLSFYCSPVELKPSNMASIQLPPLMTREDFLDHLNLPPKLLALNNWLLDGELGSDSKPGYRAYKKDHVRIVYSHVFIDSKLLILSCSGCSWVLFQSRTTKPRHRGTKTHDNHRARSNGCGHAR